MTRRDFLQFQLRAAAVLAAAGSGLAVPCRLFAKSLEPAVPDISVARGDAEQAARAAVQRLGGMERFVRPGSRVVIKPNMSFANPPEMATTTNPLVVKTLAAMCLEAKAADVAVLDHPLRTASLCLERSGIGDACGALGYDMAHGLVNPDLYAETAFPKGREMKQNQVMKQMLKADVLIAAPVAKSHSSAGVSLSLKGMMGLILDRGVMHSGYDLSQAIVDLNSFLAADLAVIDATRVLSTNGPSGPGKVLEEKTVIASADPVAADAYTVGAFAWWGRRLSAAHVKHIRLAADQGLGRMDVENLRTDVFAA